MSRRLEHPSSLSEPSAWECGAGCAGRHSAPRPLPRPPATPRAVDSSGAWAQGHLGPAHRPRRQQSPAEAVGLVGGAPGPHPSLPSLPAPGGAAGRAWRGAPPPGQPLLRGAGLRGGNIKERARQETRDAGARSRRAVSAPGPARHPLLCPGSRLAGLQLSCPGAALSHSLRARTAQACSFAPEVAAPRLMACGGASPGLRPAPGTVLPDDWELCGAGRREPRDLRGFAHAPPPTGAGPDPLI